MQLSQALQAYFRMVAACSFAWRTDLLLALTAYGSQHLGKATAHQHAFVVSIRQHPFKTLTL